MLAVSIDIVDVVNRVVDGIECRERLFDICVYDLRLHVGDHYRARGAA